MASNSHSASFRTPYVGVKGLAKGHGEATRHFIGQRVSGIAAVPLCLVMLYVAYQGFFAPYDQALTLVRHPFFAISSFLFTSVVLYHMKLGMQVIITDYIHTRGCQLVALIKNVFFCGLVGAIMLYSLFKIIFGSGA